MGAVENRSVVFQGAVGAFFASTAPAASTGPPSRLDPLPRSAVLRELLIRVMILDGVMPRMIGRLARRGRGRLGGSARCRGGAARRSEPG